MEPYNNESNSSGKSRDRRPYTQAELEEIKRKMDLFLKPTSNTIIKSSVTYFVDFCKEIISYLTSINDDTRITPYKLRNLYFYEKDQRFHDTFNDEKNVKTVNKNCKQINAILNFIDYYCTEWTTIPYWQPIINTENPRHADYLQISLNGRRLKRIIYKIYSNSQHYRFGLKFVGGELFGENDIQSLDNNVVFHTGRGSAVNHKCDELFITLYLDGKRAIRGGLRSRDMFTGIEIYKNECYNCEIKIDENDIAHFSINGQEFEKDFVNKILQTNPYLFSWADDNDYEMYVKDIRFETWK